MFSVVMTATSGKKIGSLRAVDVNPYVALRVRIVLNVEGWCEHYLLSYPDIS